MGNDTTKDTQFEDLFQQIIEDLYDAEKQIAEALPQMIAAASSIPLSAALESHLEQTREHITRLDGIFESMAVTPGRECRVLAAMLDDGGYLLADQSKSLVLDAAIVSTAQKIEHYEIAGYRSASLLAQMLGRQDAFEALEDTLKEERDADETLADIADALLSGDLTATPSKGAPSAV